MNYLENGSKCLICVVVDDMNNIQELSDIYAMFDVGNVVTANDKRILPVYPNLDAVIRDTLDANFNSSIDKSWHFDAGDIDNLIIFECTLLGDATATDSPDVFIAKACAIDGMCNMDQIRDQLKTKAIKFGLIDPEDKNQDKKSAYKEHKEKEPEDEPDYQHILQKYDMERVYAHLSEAKDPSKVDLEGKFGIAQS